MLTHKDGFHPAQQMLLVPFWEKWITQLFFLMHQIFSGI
jgi:hypothetical protein